MSSALSKIVSKSATKGARVRSTSSALASISRRNIATIPSTGTSASNNDNAAVDAASNDNLSWSQNLSFTSPEADFTSAGTGASISAADMSKDATISATKPNEKIWSEKMSFASPEADFTTSASQIHLHYASNGGDDNRTSSNFKATSARTGYGQNPNPEFHFYSKQETFNEFMSHVEKDEDQLNDLAYALSHVTIEGSKVEGVSDFDHYAEFRELLNDRQKQQLNHVDNMNLGLDLDLGSKNSKNSISRDMDSTTQSSLDLNSVNQLISDTMAAKGMNSSSKAKINSNSDIDINSNPFHEAPLPRNLAEASFPNDQRAIVITEASIPFRITHVNDSWENLCGFTQDESRGQTLGCLQGPETNTSAVTALMSRLLNGEKEVGTLLTNYTKNGRKFHNRLRVGPLKDHSGAVTHYVGVLCEVNENGEHFDDRNNFRAGTGGKGSRTMQM